MDEDGRMDQDTGEPDQAEWDPATLNSAEELDEDELGVDPLEEGAQAPDHWSVAETYGTTAYEQEQGEGLDRKLAAERPDVEP